MATKSRIQGITIELDGEVTGLEKALKDVTMKSVDLQGELRDVDRLLKFDPGNVEALAQKQDILTKQIENTTEKLDRLKSAQDEVEKQFQNGDIGEKQYRAFKREVEYTEKSIKDLNSRLSEISGSEVSELKKDFNKLEESTEEAKDGIKDVGSELLNLAAGTAAVITVGEVLEKALDVSSLNTKIDISFDVPEESIGSVKEATNAVIAYGVDAEEALEGVRRQWALNKGYSDEEKISMTKYAAAITNAYAGIDFNELIQESYELSSSLQLNNDESLGLTNSLLKIGFPPDQLDIITEYGSQLSRAGYTAEEIQAIMKAGVETGSWNIDNLLDGLKEGRIVLSEFGQGIDEATAELFSKIGISKDQVESWGQAVANGGESGKSAMVEVAKAISNIEDSTLQNQIGVKVYGTLWEEQGAAITNTIIRANDEVVSLKDNQEGLNSTVNSLDSDPAIAMKQAMLDLQLSMQPLLSVIADIIGKIAQWIQDNPTLTGTIVAIVTVLGVLMGIFMALSPIMTVLQVLAGALGVSVGAIAAPVLIVIGVIAALIAIGVALYKNWDEIKAKCIEIWNSIKGFFNETWQSIKTTFMNSLSNIFSTVIDKFNNIKSSISNKMYEVKSSISSIWSNVMDFFRNINLFDIGRNIIQGLINGVKNMASSLVNSVKGVVDGAIEGAKNLLGIHSPSRVFMEFGEYSGEGFINGIESMKNAVAKAGQDMADASISLVPNVQNSGINQINSIMENSDDTRQIFVLQQYMDSNEIAEYTYQLVGGKLALAGKRRR
ncbi:MAG: hypothetical protein E6300_07570 [Clostridium sp.]|uniref:hypothetical protein n=1 Tax=Clostridium sp. TaxID=1506 RepID=UPI001ED5CC0D|nr:hypothetical protein [Clostridium sp.]MBS5886301.1 hypothetical protein [Clostridium sp.]MDU7148332.1 hypothetical protein [Clostridium sp.]